MVFSEKDIKVLEEVPAGKWHEVIEFARFLTESTKSEMMQEKKPLRHGGWVESEIWMSDDFDDPMEFVSPEEMKVLEAIRNSKREELQEAVV